MRVLILCGKGYIGSRLDPYLTDAGHSVINIDLEWFGNYLDKKSLVTDFNNINSQYIVEAEAIVLLAGHSSVKMCLGDYYSSFNNNVRNTLRLVERIRLLNPATKLIYASSSSIYGNTNGNVADESQEEFVCANNYDLTKYIVDQYMLKNNPIPNWYGLRFGTVNGWSLNHRSELMINSMTKSAVDNGKVVISNKHIHRAILGITDLCRGIERIVSSTGVASGVYNMNSFNSTVEDIATVVSNITQTNIIDQGIVGKTYDFMISSDKFENAFDFKFQQNAESIVNELLDNYHSLNMTNRDNGVVYE
jgi:nucleoside-diphosphate-sugar epimerase